jgi:hypothetical protein
LGQQLRKPQAVLVHLSRVMTMSACYDAPTTKGGHADLLPIAQLLRPFLVEAIERFPSALVFPKPDGTMYSPELKLDHVLRRALGRAGVVIGFIHNIRRSRPCPGLLAPVLSLTDTLEKETRSGLPFRARGEPLIHVEDCWQIVRDLLEALACLRAHPRHSAQQPNRSALDPLNQALHRSDGRDSIAMLIPNADDQFQTTGSVSDR